MKNQIGTLCVENETGIEPKHMLRALEDVGWTRTESLAQLMSGCCFVCFHMRVM